MKAKKRGLIAREGLVLDWTMSIYVRVEGSKLARERESSQYLTLDGEFTEPLKGIVKFSLQVHAEAQPGLGAREIPSLGAVLRVKPEIQAAGTLTPAEFESVLLLTSTGKLRSVHMTFQEPRYGSALIASMSFSSRPPGDE